MWEFTISYHPSNLITTQTEANEMLKNNDRIVYFPRFYLEEEERKLKKDAMAERHDPSSYLTQTLSKWCSGTISKDEMQSILRLSVVKWIQFMSTTDLSHLLDLQIRSPNTIDR
ncbi:hypothetical protein NXS19_012255 [Fusarium pseudograminearum]|nr:hypothetical protein NXS19_012255 [Fusarium pseudograminearum]